MFIIISAYCANFSHHRALIKNHVSVLYPEILGLSCGEDTGRELVCVKVTTKMGQAQDFDLGEFTV